MRKILRDLTLRWRIEERYILEKKIFPKLKNRKILWVGCAKYTKTYPKILEKNNNLVWTIDIDSKMAQFGGKNHIVDTIANAYKYFKKNSLDIIFLTGVFGYGLNKKQEAELTMKTCHDILKRRGLLIVWWGDRPGRNMINPSKLKNSKLFEQISLRKYPFSYRTKKNVVLEFYKKP